MSYKISKELFEAVTKNKTDDVELYIDKNSIRYWTCEENRARELYIDTFFFKCKEWAYKQECELLSGYRVYDIQYKGNNSENKIYCDCKYIENGIQVIRFKADSEQQAVFDACMYILDKDKQ